jgi:hypothetical protein
MGNTGEYVEPLRKEFFEVFKRLKKKYVMLLITNSHYHYTEAMMGHIFGKDWASQFQIIIVRSRKPKFY